MWFSYVEAPKAVQQPAIILFRYRTGDNVNEEPVYNVDVMVPDDAPIIRAHDLGPQRNRETLRVLRRSGSRRAPSISSIARRARSSRSATSPSSRRLRPSSSHLHHAQRDCSRRCYIEGNHAPCRIRTLTIASNTSWPTDDISSAKGPSASGAGARPPGGCARIAAST